jgi:hypothetical protein
MSPFSAYSEIEEILYSTSGGENGTVKKSFSETLFSES